MKRLADLFANRLICCSSYCKISKIDFHLSFAFRCIITEYINHNEAGKQRKNQERYNPPFGLFAFDLNSNVIRLICLLSFFHMISSA